MAAQRPRAWCVCLSAVLVLIGIFAILTTSFSPFHIHFGTDRPCVRSEHECSNPNILGSHPQVFTSYTYQGAAQHYSNMSLLAQARKVLDENAGNDFVQLRENGAKPKRYGVSMFHQLHCLELLRSSAVSGCSTSSHAHHGRDVGEMDHVGHCFQYLAQGIMCAADDTIEPSFVAETPAGEKIRVINGDGVVHQCRRFGDVYTAMVQSQTKPITMKRGLAPGDTLREILNLEG